MFQGFLKQTVLGPEVSHTRVTPGATEAGRTEKQSVDAMWPGADTVRDAVHREKTGGETEGLGDRETQREGGRQEVDRWRGQRNRGTKGETEGPCSAFVRGRVC